VPESLQKTPPVLEEVDNLVAPQKQDCEERPNLALMPTRRELQDRFSHRTNLCAISKTHSQTGSPDHIGRPVDSKIYAGKVIVVVTQPMASQPRGRETNRIPVASA
jgi:hypothetical protein